MGRINPGDRFEEIDWFLQCGVHPLMILDQIGVKVVSITKYCERHGRPDLVAVFQPYVAEERALRRVSRAKTSTMEEVE